MKTLLLSGQGLEAFEAPLKEAFEPEGLSVHYLAFSQQDFKTRLAAMQPDLLMMPAATLNELENEDGQLWLKELRANPDLKDLGVLLMGAPRMNEPEALADWLNAGLEDCLPVYQNPRELVARLRLYLKQKHQYWTMQEMNRQLTQMNDDLYERNAMVEKDLYKTRQLQQSLLPRPMAEPAKPKCTDAGHNKAITGSEGLDTVTSHVFSLEKKHYHTDKLKVTGVYLPCDALGGDLYDVIEFKDKSIGVTMADVSGHGVAAGFVTALFKSSFYRATLQHMSPDKVLFDVNNELADMVTTGEYVTALYTRIMPDGRSIEFSGAGHPYPIIYEAATGQIQRPEENGTPLVWIPGMEYGIKRLELNPGDKVLLFTDGVSEIRNMAEALLGEDALERMFKETIAEEPANLLDSMVMKLSDYTEGMPLNDDLSMALIEVLS